MIVDVIEAVIAYLETKVEITNLCSERIFGGGLPKDELDDMPRKCITLRYSGGAERYETMWTVRPRIDIRSYGETDNEASKIDRAVFTALHDMVRVTQGTTLLHSAGLAGGPVMMTDPANGWPFIFRAAIINAHGTEVE